VRPADARAFGGRQDALGCLSHTGSSAWRRGTWWREARTRGRDAGSGLRALGNQVFDFVTLALYNTPDGSPGGQAPNRG